MHLHPFALALLLAAQGPLPTLATPAPSVIRLEITSQWEGLEIGTPRRLPSRLTVECDQHACVAGADAPVDRAMLDHLRRILEGPPRPIPDAPTLGVPWEKLRRVSASFRACPDAEALANRILWRYFMEDWRTDDYPTVQGSITLSDGSVIEFSSSSQKLLMLPWAVRCDGRSQNTFDPALSKALLDLLPASFEDRSRIAGIGIGRDEHDFEQVILMGLARAAAIDCNAVQVPR